MTTRALTQSDLPMFLLGAVCLAPLASAAQPVVTSGRLGTGTVDVTKPAASPLVTLNISGQASGVQFYYQSPSGSQQIGSFNSGYTGAPGSPPPYTGKTTFQGYAPPYGPNNVLSLYAEPGAWTLLEVTVCGVGSPCTSYSGSSLQALFPKLTFNVSNPGTPDATPPAAVSASIKTPMVSIANGPAPAIDVDATDNFSGVLNIQVVLTVPGSPNAIFLSNPAPARPITKGVFKLYGQIQTGTAPGTYTVSNVYVSDIAGNANLIYDASTLAKLFNNKTTIEVTN